MKRMIEAGWAVAIMVAMIGFLASAADVKVKEEPVPKNSFARLTVELEKDQSVLWDVYPEPTTSEEFFTEKEAGKTTGNLHFNGAPGTYKVRVTVLSIKAGRIVTERQTKSVTLTGGGGGGDDVDPEPDPVDPVEGFGVGPVVTTSLVPGFKLAWRKDAANERVLVKQLADLYAKYANESYLVEFATWGGLESAMRADAEKSGLAGNLVNTQTAVAKYLTQYLPGGKPDWEKVVLNGKSRKSAKTAFNNVAVALRAVK